MGKTLVYLVTYQFEIEGDGAKDAQIEIESSSIQEIVTEFSKLLSIWYGPGHFDIKSIARIDAPRRLTGEQLRDSIKKMTQNG